MSTKVAINADWGGFMVTPEMRTWLLVKGCDNFYELERHDPILIECIEACKDVGDIVIVEIDEDKYFIIDYDGVETLYTPETCPWILTN